MKRQQRCAFGDLVAEIDLEFCRHLSMAGGNFHRGFVLSTVF